MLWLMTINHLHQLLLLLLTIWNNNDTVNPTSITTSICTLRLLNSNRTCWLPLPRSVSLGRIPKAKTLGVRHHWVLLIADLGLRCWSVGILAPHNVSSWLFGTDSVKDEDLVVQNTVLLKPIEQVVGQGRRHFFIFSEVLDFVCVVVNVFGKLNNFHGWLALPIQRLLADFSFLFHNWCANADTVDALLAGDVVDAHLSGPVVLYRGRLRWLSNKLRSDSTFNLNISQSRSSTRPFEIVKNLRVRFRHHFLRWLLAATWVPLWLCWVHSRVLFSQFELVLSMLSFACLLNKFFVKCHVGH